MLALAMRMRHALAMTLNSLVHISEKEEREASRLLRPAVKLWPSDSHCTALHTLRTYDWSNMKLLKTIGDPLKLNRVKLNSGFSIHTGNLGDI